MSGNAEWGAQISVRLRSHAIQVMCYKRLGAVSPPGLSKISSSSAVSCNLRKWQEEEHEVNRLLESVSRDQWSPAYFESHLSPAKRYFPRLDLLQCERAITGTPSGGNTSNMGCSAPQDGGDADVRGV